MKEINQELAHGNIGSIRKEWKDQTADEKIESIRNQVRDFRYLIHRVVKLENELREFRKHQHGIKGEMLLPAEERYGGDSASMSFDTLA